MDISKRSTKILLTGFCALMGTASVALWAGVYVASERLKEVKAELAQIKNQVEYSPFLQCKVDLCALVNQRCGATVTKEGVLDCFETVIAGMENRFPEDSDMWSSEEHIAYSYACKNRAYVYNEDVDVHAYVAKLRHDVGEITRSYYEQENTPTVIQKPIGKPRFYTDAPKVRD